MFVEKNGAQFKNHGDEKTCFTIALRSTSEKYYITKPLEQQKFT